MLSRGIVHVYVVQMCFGMNYVLLFHLKKIRSVGLDLLLSGELFDVDSPLFPVYSFMKSIILSNFFIKTVTLLSYTCIVIVEIFHLLIVFPRVLDRASMLSVMYPLVIA